MSQETEFLNPEVELSASTNANVSPDSFDWESFESGLDANDRKEKS